MRLNSYLNTILVNPSSIPVTPITFLAFSQPEMKILQGCCHSLLIKDLSVKKKPQKTLMKLSAACRSVHNLIINILWHWPPWERFLLDLWTCNLTCNATTFLSSLQIKMLNCVCCTAFLGKFSSGTYKILLSFSCLLNHINFLSIGLGEMLIHILINTGAFMLITCYSKGTQKLEDTFQDANLFQAAILIYLLCEDAAGSLISNETTRDM